MPTPNDLSVGTLLAMPERAIPAEFHPALIVLSMPTLQNYPRIARYVDFDAKTFDYERALAEGGMWSDGERKMVKVAATLWGGSDLATLRDAISLDDPTLRRLLAAIAVHRGWMTFKDALTEALADEAKKGSGA